MFSITTLDLVRLDSDHSAQNYMVHARAAERLATAAFWVRVAILGLQTVATASAIAMLLWPSRVYAVTVLVAAAAALLTFTVQAAIGLDTRVAAHRQLAHRVWLVAEHFRALVAEASEGLIDGPAVLRRRDELVHDLHAIYEHGFAADQPARETARLPPWPADRAA
jgi:hypothetical protein